MTEAFAAMGKDIAKATHQEMRSRVCAQCHVEYCFKAEPKNYLAFPWANGTTVDAAYEYCQAAEDAQKARLLCARVLAGHGIIKAPNHPDTSTREKAWAVDESFKDGKPPKLLP